MPPTSDRAVAEGEIGRHLGREAAEAVYKASAPGVKPRGLVLRSTKDGEVDSVMASFGSKQSQSTLIGKQDQDTLSTTQNTRPFNAHSIVSIASVVRSSSLPPNVDVSNSR